MKKVALIGAGPAGIALSFFLKNFDGEVHLFEQNADIGEKLKLTGGGRMNVTNRNLDDQYYFSSNQKILKNIFKSPWVAKRYDLLAELGIQYIWENNRAIVASKDAPLEVARLKSQFLAQRNGTLHPHSKITDLQKKENGFEIQWDHSGKGKTEIFDIVVFCSGGMFRINDLGSVEKIYKLPLSLGHTLIQPSPMLSPLRIVPNPFLEFPGTAIRAKLTDMPSKKSCEGDCLFTHQGVSGPVILDFSAVFSGGEILFNFLPDMSEEIFMEKFKALHQGKNAIKSFLKPLFPQKIMDWLLGQSHISPMSNIADISKVQFAALRNTIFRYQIKTATTMDFSCCWTTKGGIPLDEINAATLESRVVPHVFFAGEILDVNGLCGGYNITFAIVSAKIVAEALLKKENETNNALSL